MKLDPRHVQLRIVPLLSLTIFISVLNGVMFNIAVPDIADEHRVSPAIVSWVVTGYVVFFAFGSVVYARLGDSFHLRDLITAGLLLFCTGSLLGFLTDSFALLIVARMIQAAGAAGIPALSMLLATVYVPKHMRGSVLGVIASTVALGLGVGPVAGGLIAGYLHWNYLFLTPLALFPVIFLLRRALPLQSELRRETFDFFGTVLLALSVGCLLIAVNLQAGIAAVFFPLLASAFIWRMRSISYPVVHPELFYSKGYLQGVLVALLVMGTIFATFFIMPLMFRHLYHMPTMQIGLYLFPGAISAALSGLVAGRIADRCGPALVVKAGFLILLFGFSLIIFTAGISPLLSAASLVAANSGFTVIHSSLAGSVSRTLPLNRVGQGMGVFNLVFFISGAIGTAAAGMFLEMLGPDSPESYSMIFTGCLILGSISLALFMKSFRNECGS